MPFKGPPLKNTRKFTFGRKATFFSHLFANTTFKLNPKSRRKQFLPEPFERYWVFLFVNIYKQFAVDFAFFSESRARDKFIVSHSIIYGYGIDAQLVDVYGTCS